MNTVISFFKRGGKKHAFEDTVTPHINLLYRQAYQYTGTPHDAEDLVQELLVDLYQKQDQLNKIESIKGWLLRCLYNRFIDNYRKTKNHPKFDDIHDSDNKENLADTACPATEYWHGQIIAGLKSLSNEQQMVISLHDIEGYTLLEISHIMKIPLGTLKSHLHRGRQSMKKKFKLQPFDDDSRL